VEEVTRKFNFFSLFERYYCNNSTTDVFLTFLFIIMDLIKGSFHKYFLEKINSLDGVFLVP